MSNYLLNFDYFANVPLNNNFLNCYNLFSPSMYNINSDHKLGSYTNKVYDTAIQNILKCFHDYNYIEFIPGGASMANKRSILGSISSKPKLIAGIRKDVILISSIEHTSIINYIIPILLDNDYTIAMIKCDNDGIISLDNLEQLLKYYGKRIVMISIMNVNNETGIIQNISSYISKIKEFDNNIIFHSDITQGLSIFWDNQYKPDILTLSGYKLGGPHLGIVISKYKLNDDYTGTPDVASIYTLSTIIESKFKKHNDFKFDSKYNFQLKKYILNYILKWFNNNNIKYNLLSTFDNSLDNVISLLLYGYQTKIIQQMLSDKNICIGIGSASQSMKSVGSHVLRAMGYSTDVTFNLIRISWGDVININDLYNNDIIDTNNNILYADILLKSLCEIIDKMKPLISLPQHILSITKFEHILKKPTTKKKEILQEINRLVNDYDNYDSIEDLLTIRIKLSISETNLKGKNKYEFINYLKSDILYRLLNDIWNVCETNGLLILTFNDNIKLQKQSELTYDTIQILKYIPGISLIIPQYSVISYNNQNTFYNLMKIVLYLYHKNIKNNDSIAIDTIIKKKSFLTYRNKDINIILGKLLSDKFKAPINLKRPSIKFNISINTDKINISIEQFKGIAGFPLGSGNSIAIILNNKNYIRSLVSTIQLSICGSKIICYSYIDAENFDIVIRKINPYVTYQLVKSADNVQQLLNIISENYIIYENSTNNFIQHISYLKELSTSSNKYITTMTSHLSFDKLLQYLSEIGIDYSKLSFYEEFIDNTIKDNHGIISMISGGINSFVSTKLMFDYCKTTNSIIKLVHFSSNINKIDIVKNIRDKIDKNLELFIVDFSNLHNEIFKHCPINYRRILYKIFFILIANKIMRAENLQCIIMGNFLGQFMSKTFYNLFIENNFSKFPIYNPLLGLSKSQIILQAQQYTTYNFCSDINDHYVIYLPKHFIKKNYDEITNYIERFANLMDMVKILKI